MLTIVVCLIIFLLKDALFHKGAEECNTCQLGPKLPPILAMALIFFMKLSAGD